MKMKYKRVLLKLSGEGLMGDEKFGISPKVLQSLALQIKDIVDSGVELCIVVGGGNIFRGAKGAAKGMNRTVADQVGMLATLMNALCLQNALEENGVSVRVSSGLSVPQVCENYMYRKAMRHLEKKRVVIFAGGTGNPYFTTDTGAVLRASEMQCDAVLKSTQVDGVYSADPKTNADAIRYDEISYNEVIQKQLNVMDMTAVALAKENTKLAGIHVNYINRDFMDFRHEYLFDEIITNMPLRGKKTKQEMDEFYYRFFRKAKEILKKEAVLILYTNEIGFVKKQLRLNKEYRLLQEYCLQPKNEFYLLIIGYKD